MGTALPDMRRIEEIVIDGDTRSFVACFSGSFRRSLDRDPRLKPYFRQKLQAQALIDVGCGILCQ